MINVLSSLLSVLLALFTALNPGRAKPEVYASDTIWGLIKVLTGNSAGFSEVPDDPSGEGSPLSRLSTDGEVIFTPLTEEESSAVREVLSRIRRYPEKLSAYGRLDTGIVIYAENYRNQPEGTPQGESSQVVVGPFIFRLNDRSDQLYFYTGEKLMPLASAYSTGLISDEAMDAVHRIYYGDDVALAELHTLSGAEKVLRELLSAGRISISQVPSVYQQQSGVPIHSVEAEKSGSWDGNAVMERYLSSLSFSVPDPAPAEKCIRLESRDHEGISLEAYFPAFDPATVILNTPDDSVAFTGDTVDEFYEYLQLQFEAAAQDETVSNDGSDVLLSLKADLNHDGINDLLTVKEKDGSVSLSVRNISGTNLLQSDITYSLTDESQTQTIWMLLHSDGQDCLMSYNPNTLLDQ